MRKYMSFAERWPLATLELSDELNDNVKSRAAVNAIADGRAPHRTHQGFKALALKVRL